MEAGGRNSPASFPPTVPPSPDSTLQPKNTRFGVNYDVTVRDGADDKTTGFGSDYKTSLYDKYSRNKLKNSLFHKKDQKGSKEVEEDPVFHPPGVPLGANTDIFRSYAGDKLSQADFERNILGVSTQTEISVKSMICVKGRCFNANDNS